MARTVPLMSRIVAMEMMRKTMGTEISRLTMDTATVSTLNVAMVSATIGAAHWVPIAVKLVPRDGSPWVVPVFVEEFPLGTLHIIRVLGRKVVVPRHKFPGVTGRDAIPLVAPAVPSVAAGSPLVMLLAQDQHFKARREKLAQQMGSGTRATVEPKAGQGVVSLGDHLSSAAPRVRPRCRYSIGTSTWESRTVASSAKSVSVNL